MAKVLCHMEMQCPVESLFPTSVLLNSPLVLRGACFACLILIFVVAIVLRGVNPLLGRWGSGRMQSIARESLLERQHEYEMILIIWTICRILHV